MADSKPLFSPDGDPMAAEALLRDVFGIVMDEVIRKGTSASEKVGPFPSSCPLYLAPNFPLPTRLHPPVHHCLAVCLRDYMLPPTVYIYPCSRVTWETFLTRFPRKLRGGAGSRSVGCPRAARTSRSSHQVCEWKEPEELKRLLDLELRSEGEAAERILARCREVIHYSVKTCGSWAAAGGASGVCPSTCHGCPLSSLPPSPLPFSRSPALLQPALLRVGSPFSGGAHCH